MKNSNSVLYISTIIFTAIYRNLRENPTSQGQKQYLSPSVCVEMILTKQRILDYVGNPFVSAPYLATAKVHEDGSQSNMEYL